MPKSGLATKRLDQLAPTLAHTCRIHLEMVMGEIKITPCDLGRIWGVLGAENQKSGINYQTDGPIGTKFCTHVRIHLGMDIG